MVCAGTSLAAQAQVGLNARPWSKLTNQQQTALAPLESGWAGIDAARQQKWLDVAGRFASMSAEEQELVQRRMGDWAGMTSSERRRARVNFQALKQETENDELQSRWQAYQALPESQRRELAKRATASQSASGTLKIQAERVDGQKSTVVKPVALTVAPRAVAPAVVQAGPGATTTLVSRKPSPPAHVQPGLPKLAGKPDLVDPKTLLPKRPAQAPGADGAKESPADAH
jgi:hypothetical protein